MIRLLWNPKCPAFARLHWPAIAEIWGATESGARGAVRREVSRLTCDLPCCTMFRLNLDTGHAGTTDSGSSDAESVFNRACQCRQTNSSKNTLHTWRTYSRRGSNLQCWKVYCYVCNMICIFVYLFWYCIYICTYTVLTTWKYFHFGFI